MGQTLGDLWRAATAEQREFPACLVQRDGDWAPVSWSEAAVRVDRLASRLLALGVRRGDRFAILGRTTLDWALLDWALLSPGSPLCVGASDWLFSPPCWAWVCRALRI